MCLRHGRHVATSLSTRHQHLSQEEDCASPGTTREAEHCALGLGECRRIPLGQHGRVCTSGDWTRQQKQLCNAHKCSRRRGEMRREKKRGRLGAEAGEWTGIRAWQHLDGQAGLAQNQSNLSRVAKRRTSLGHPLLLLLLLDAGCCCCCSAIVAHTLPYYSLTRHVYTIDSWLIRFPARQSVAN